MKKAFEEYLTHGFNSHMLQVIEVNSLARSDNRTSEMMTKKLTINAIELLPYQGQQYYIPNIIAYVRDFHLK